MYKVMLAIIALSLSGALMPASALEANDTMRAWKTSSAQERSDLLNGLLGTRPADPDRAGLLTCLDSAAAIPGHADLEIGEVVEACKSSKGSGQPV